MDLERRGQEGQGEIENIGRNYREKQRWMLVNSICF